jgi:hypothetical protein
VRKNGIREGIGEEIEEKGAIHDRIHERIARLPEAMQEQVRIRSCSARDEIRK